MAMVNVPVVANKLSVKNIGATTLTGATAAAVAAYVDNAAKAAAASQAKKKTTPATGTQTQTTTQAQKRETSDSTILIKWHDIEFFASASKVVGFNDLSISGSVETEDKEDGGTKYVSKKNSKGYEVTMTAFFDRRLGIEDVKKSAMSLAEYGAKGQTGYMYAQGEKLISSNLMMTAAKIGNIRMTPGGTWICCEIQITLKTCGKLEASDIKPSPTGNTYKFSCTVYYSGSSGAIQSVWAGSNISKDDARKKAWAKVPKSAHWASENKNQATNQSPELTDAILASERKKVEAANQQKEAAKQESAKTGITYRYNQVKTKQNKTFKLVSVD